MDKTQLFFNLRTLAKLDFTLAQLSLDLLELENQTVDDLQRAYISKKKAEIQIEQIHRTNFIKDNKLPV